MKKIKKKPAKFIEPEIFDHGRMGKHGMKIFHFEMAKEHRRKGHGSRFIRELIEALPENIHCIYVTPANQGDGDPTGFWKKLGFRPVYNVEQGDEDPEEMILGINGHETPDPIPLPWKKRKD